MPTANHRLKTLRLINGMNQGDFANILGIKQPLLSMIERGDRELTTNHIVTARMYFRLPADYFDKPEITYQPNQLNFRRKKLTKNQATMAAHTFGLIEQHYADQPNPLQEFPCTPTPTRRSTKDIEAIAADTRAQLGIKPDTPIRNVTRCMDRLGIIVTALANPLLPADKIDGISTPAQTGHALVTTLNYSTPGDRFRFSAAHELGHVLLHTNDEVKSLEDKEAEADDFAAAFLMPAGPMRDLLTADLTLNGYAAVKSKWGTSIQALVRRARDLGVIDDDRYRSLFIQLSGRGWRTREPVEVQLESMIHQPPELWIAHAGRRDGPGLASVTQLPRRE
ncbi:ImmA/IrrE family metallo-endopeptidase [Corynebacterium lizhenjunii]|uniref:ImmA/IrrE family metallo-endopeptidase n=1 Tax=Corynebacterium lizhenjunii TaxID=2709394 RepID=A0A7T0PB29_9CORY|nr:XRE family transcriptional regulator [Corynebacterium lizhenjunii]QPK78312.1 ImmA/IrrE family metallo-endopeptidase [Corynebacterium lizhenjunii]